MVFFRYYLALAYPFLNILTPLNQIHQSCQSYLYTFASVLLHMALIVSFVFITTRSYNNGLTTAIKIDTEKLLNLHDTLQAVDLPHAQQYPAQMVKGLLQMILALPFP